MAFVLPLLSDVDNLKEEAEILLTLFQKQQLLVFEVREENQIERKIILSLRGGGGGLL